MAWTGQQSWHAWEVVTGTIPLIDEAFLTHNRSSMVAQSPSWFVAGGGCWWREASEVGVSRRSNRLAR
jgi:hypothetical protein